MQVKKSIHRRRLIAFGAVLCLLAAVFSFEAKIARYCASSAHAEISAAKIQQAEASRLASRALVAQAIGGSDHFAHLNLQFAWQAVFALFAGAFMLRRRTDFGLTRTSASPGFFPFRFSRPPPSR